MPILGRHPGTSAASLLMHGFRIALLTTILLLMYWQQQRTISALRGSALDSVSLEQLRLLFPQADALGGAVDQGARSVLAAEEVIGSVMQTSPEGDHFLGFSGPTNTLIGLDLERRIIGLAILSSHDTRDHVALIQKDPLFLKALHGLSENEAARKHVDAVAGATLTSLAILQGVQARLGRLPESLKFPDAYAVDDAVRFFPDAVAVHRDRHVPELWLVTGEKETPLGWLLSNSPIGDETIGYQGPTRAMLGMNLDGKIQGLVVGESFDNDPYVGYVRGDSWFSKVLNNKSIEEWGRTTWRDAGIDGVSGATMTSQAVAEGLLKAARRLVEVREQETQSRERQTVNRWKTLATASLIFMAILLSMTRGRHLGTLRRGYQIVLIIVMGFINGDILSMAMFVGWAKSGIPIQNATGLVLLTLAAIVLPVCFKQNLYCDHLCPHGAVQQLLPRRWKWKRRPRAVLRILTCVRPVLLLLVILVPMLEWGISLVDLEPFDAYAWRAAGAATITLAIASVIASLFIPMGYCHYGCPTGAVLGYLRRHSRSGQFTRSDAFAVGLLVLALACFHWGPG